LSQWLLLAHPYQHPLATDSHCKVCAIAGQPMAAPAYSVIFPLFCHLHLLSFFFFPLPFPLLADSFFQSASSFSHALTFNG